MKRHVIYVSALLLTQSLISIFTQAQNKKQADSLRALELEEVVISATRFPEKKKYVQQQVEVISAERLSRWNQPNTALMLEQSGQVFVQKSQLGGGSPVLRGFEANKVLLVIDGVRLNNAIYRGGHLQNSITVDASMLEKMEVLFGPGSVMYGSDALGGVIHFTTKSPEFSTNDKDAAVKDMSLFIRGNTAFGEKTVHGDISYGGRRWAFISSFTRTDMEDLRQGANYFDDYPDWGPRTFYVKRINGIDSVLVNDDPERQRYSGYTQYDVLQKIRFRPGKRVEHLLNLQYSTSSDIPRYDRLILTRNNRPRFAEWYYGPQDRWLASYQLSLDSGYGYTSGKIVASYQHIGESRYDRAFRDPVRSEREETVRVASLNADFRLNKGKLEWGYGAEFVYNDVQSVARGRNIESGVLTALDTRYPDGGSSLWQAAAYATQLWKMTPGWTLNMGARFSGGGLDASFISKEFFPFPFSEIRQRATSLSGSMGLIWMPGGNWRMTAGVSNGFRMPNVDDMAKVFESVPGRLIVPNPDLKPERTLTSELSVGQSGGSLEWNILGYYTWYNQALTLDAGTLNGSDSVDYGGTRSAVFTTVNKNRAYLAGGQAQVSWKITSVLKLRASYQYTYARIRTDTTDYPLDHIPPAFGAATLSWSPGSWLLEAGVLFNAEKKSRHYNLQGEDNAVYSADPVNGYTPAWQVLNLRVEKQWGRHWRLQVAVDNLLDKYYRVFASGLSGAGRNLIVTARYRL